MMVDVTITRKFAVDVDIDTSVFDEVKNMVNYFMNDLRVNSSEFTPLLFQGKSNKSVKSLYNLYKKYLNDNS